ncbi:hypothetical protein WR25_04106 [Diploscapter pachys]|uniref:DNA/RNA-binding protein Alba-like domain-containing protein n=1 Tax=Diploscapter pachys TaxID=2018661 RepID=A0A2A2J1T9_9BILA|nr:hypothetical protein WR25_04106 [Diploscapter pachys]
MTDENYELGTEERIEWPEQIFPEEVCGTSGTKWIDVRVNSKFEKLNTYVRNYFEKFNGRFVIYRGHGEAVEKVVSCVEVFKRKFSQPLYQWTKLSLVEKVNFLEPKKEGLERLKVTASMPGLFILISLDQFPEEFNCSSMQNSTDKEPTFAKIISISKKRIVKSSEKENKWARQKKRKPKSGQEEPKPEQFLIKDQMLEEFDESLKKRSPKKRKSGSQ